MEQERVLDVKHLGVSFGATDVLSGVTFTVHRGQTVAIIGPNGSGKTVLFRALLDLVPHTGTVVWQPGVRVGYVPQSLDVDRDLPLTVAEFFSCKGVDRATTWKLLERLGLGADHTDPSHARRHIADHILPARLGTLSGGQLQRILIAWALADDPQVLLFDEPTSGIDIGGQQSVYALLNELKGERALTLLLISHDLDVVYANADHVLCISKRLVCHGPPHTALDKDTLAALYGTGVGYSQHSTVHEH
jgi:zinc transport system ATP-binding protein